MMVIAPVVFVLLLFITAPYGRYQRQGWGPVIASRKAWIMIETPASLLMLAVFLIVPVNLTIYLLLGAWQIHYFHRAFIYPFRLKSDRMMPLVVVLIAIIFNTVNAFLNGYHFVLNQSWYSSDWLYSLNFIAGAIVFATGFFITKRSDAILRNLRSGPGDGYQIPQGFLYRWVSSPNYLGESIQWLGWALMTLAPAAWVFLLWTLANLVPRALSHHRWYRENFVDYPASRKAILPYLV